MLGDDLASKKKRKKSDYPYRLEYRTRWSDNDVYDHMNNSQYNMYIDSIINAFLQEECGKEPRKSEIVGIVANSYADFFGSVEYPKVLELGLRVAKMSKSSVKYEVGVFLKNEEQVKCVGGSTHVFCYNRPQKVSTSIDPPTREKLAGLMEGEGSKL